MKDLISIIVPCYNEEESLRLFHEAVKKTEAKLPDYSFEILLVNDGSKDRTLEVMRELAQQDPEVSYFSFSRNFGKEAAMYAGFCHARGKYAAVMDADLQDPPDLLPEMLEILESGEYDSVAARRVSRAGEPPVRSWFARRFYSLINSISEADIVDGARDFRLMKREMVDAILAMGESNRFSKGIFGWIGFRTYWMPYENVERVAGKTKWNFWGLFGRPGRGLGFDSLYHHFYRRHPAALPGHHRQISRDCVPGGQKKTPLYHQREQPGGCKKGRVIRSSRVIR